MKYEWDRRKNEANIRKHGIDFYDVPELFTHPILTLLDDRVDYGEDRWVSIGVLQGIVAVVVHTERVGDIIRIISARKATRRETRRYAEAIKNEFGAP